MSSSTLATSIAHCGLPIETCWNVHSRPPATSVPRPSASPSGYCSERVRARPMSTVQLVGEVIVGRISPATRLDRELRRGRPAAPVQVEDRLARAVAGQLGLRPVRVEDPQARDEAGLVRRRELEDAVGADAQVRVAEPAHDRLA